MRIAFTVAVLVVAALLLPGDPAGLRAETPRQRLEAQGIVFTAESFRESARDGRTAALKDFLDAGMDIEAADGRGRTALQLACESGQWQAALLLLDRGAKAMPALKGLAESRRPESWLKRHVEPLGSFSPALIALVGLLFTQQYNKSQTRLAGQRAEESQRLQLIQATEKMIPHLQSKDASDAALAILFNLAESEKLAIALAELYPGRAAAQKCIELLLRRQPPGDVDAVERALWSSIYEGAGEPEKVGVYGVIELIDRLGDPGRIETIVNFKDGRGCTALMNAAALNRGGNVDRLISRGAEVAAQDRSGETALHFAARYGSRNALKVLLDAVAKWDQERRAALLELKGSRGRTALELARWTASHPPDPEKEKKSDYEKLEKRLRDEHESLGLLQ